MQRDDQVVAGVAGHRFTQPAADHALLICHGLGGYGGIYDVFCEQYALAGADVWTLDLPGFGRSASTGRRGAFTAQQWIDATSAYAEHIRQCTGLPLVVLGSSLGAFPASGATFVSDDIDACVLMGGAAVPGLVNHGIRTGGIDWNAPAVATLVEALGSTAVLKIDRIVDFDVDYGFSGAAVEKRRDPLNTWEVDLAGWASLYSYESPRAATDNTKPVLFAVGDSDPIVSVDQVKTVADGVGGPVEVHVEPDGPHQLMLFRTTRFVTIVRDFVSRVLQPGGSS